MQLVDFRLKGTNEFRENATQTFFRKLLLNFVENRL